MAMFLWKADAAWKEMTDRKRETSVSVTYQGCQYEIIDSHVHTFPDKIAEGAVGKLQKISGITPATNGTVTDTLRVMQENHVDHGILLNIATLPKQQTSINNCAKEINDSMGERFTAFGSVHFLAEDALTELERIKAMGISGIKLHPDYQDFLIDDERLFPIYEKCAALSLPIVFHAGWDCYSPDLIHAPPAASRRVLDTFPKLTMVLAHFGGLRLWDEVEASLIGQNVWLDTAMCATFGEAKQIERLIKLHDPDKILLGSDCPWEHPARSVEFILGMDLSEELKRKILSENARRLLS